MTVTYTGEVATCRGLGCFLKLLRRWKGSIYKLVWLDLIIFLIVYFTLNFVYRFALNQASQEIFESVAKYCQEYNNLIPISFVLGFYVSIVMTRWWNQYTAIPFPDTLAVYVSATVHGQDERGRVMRRTVMRYVCLAVTMTFAMISPRVKKRFPTLDHFIEAGLMHQSEKEVIADLNKKFPNTSKHWLPIVWAASIVSRARKEGRIRDDFAVKTLLDELNKFRGQCGILMMYDMISIPLVYTQVVTLAVYSYFLAAVMGQQWVQDNPFKFDMYFPFFTTLQFFFYMGWLKVAESLINPFGDDDDDFEINWMVDRNLNVAYLIVDEMHHDHPQLVKDQYWDEVLPQELPYGAAKTRETHPVPSTTNIQVNPKVESDLIGPSSVKADSMLNDMQSGPITFSARSGRNNSQNSIAVGSSVPDSKPISRTGSVTSMLKRFLSREDKSKSEEAQELTQVNVKPPATLKKLTKEVIEEVDEQTTITSQKSAKEARPSVLGLFGPPPSSEPISVPNSTSQSYSRSVYDPYPISASAPVMQDDFKDTCDRVSIGSSSSEKDEFEELKKKRDVERVDRKLQLLRSASTIKMGDVSDCELLLDSKSQPTTPNCY